MSNPSVLASIHDIDLCLVTWHLPLYLVYTRYMGFNTSSVHRAEHHLNAGNHNKTIQCVNSHDQNPLNNKQLESINWPSTVREAFAVITPAWFWAVQLYVPMSTVFTFSMKNTSSVGITCMRRSLAAGKSLPPSFCHAISGGGCPLAAHSRRAVFLVFTVMFPGVFTNVG